MIKDLGTLYIESLCIFLRHLFRLWEESHAGTVNFLNHGQIVVTGVFRRLSELARSPGLLLLFFKLNSGLFDDYFDSLYLRLFYRAFIFLDFTMLRMVFIPLVFVTRLRG